MASKIIYAIIAILVGGCASVILSFCYTGAYQFTYNYVDKTDFLAARSGTTPAMIQTPIGIPIKKVFYESLYELVALNTNKGGNFYRVKSGFAKPIVYEGKVQHKVTYISEDVLDNVIFTETVYIYLFASILVSLVGIVTATLFCVFCDSWCKCAYPNCRR